MEKNCFLSPKEALKQMTDPGGGQPVAGSNQRDAGPNIDEQWICSFSGLGSNFALRGGVRKLSL